MATFTAQVSDEAFATEGLVRVTWTNAEKKAQFYAWRVYRSIADDVSGWMPWTLVSQTVLDAPTYTFNDYGAPANKQTRYSVVQATQNAQSVITEDAKDNQRIITPADTKYWLLHPTLPAFSMALPHTTADSFSYQREEESMVLLGKGRKFDQGQELGIAGQLTVEFRDRTVYKRMLRLWRNGSWVFLRNPFGDVEKVVVRQPSMERVAGVGIREMIVTTIPYEAVFE